MSTIVLVYGCSQAIEEPHSSSKALQIINLGLTESAYAPIASTDFKPVHIASIFERAGSPPQRLHRPIPRAIWQVLNFVTNADMRIRAMETVASAIDGDTRIVVAHSLGSVAAYEALCLLPRHSVSHFITVGSPLAIPRYVRSRLAAFSAYGRYAWPRTLKCWLNFFDSRDLVALFRLRPHFGDGYRIEDHAVNLSFKNPHRLTAYLESQDLIASLGQALLLDVRPAAVAR